MKTFSYFSAGSPPPAVLYVLIVSLLASCGAGESLHLLPSGPNFRVDAGSDATLRLQCVLNGDSINIGGSFSWTKDSGQALSNTEDGHVTITLSDSGTVSTLTINGVHSDDEGQYTCSYDAGGLSTVSIMVDVDSDPHFKNVSEHQVLTEGTDAVVECPAFLGDPPGEMYWFRNNQFITDDRFIGEDGQLTIQNVRQEDAGIYECSLYRNGIQDSRDITVTVQAQDELAPDIVEHQNLIQVVYGEPLDLTCELVEAKNDVQYSWTIATDFEQNHLVNTTQQLHRDAGEFLSGRYTCRAENQYGYDEELFFVKILAPPLPNPCSETPKRINEGQTVVLSHCKITSPVQLSDLQFQWSKRRENGEMTEIEPDEVKYRLNHEGLLTIVKAQPSDSGLYQVNISNDQGYAVHSIQLEVVDIPHPPTPPTATIKVTFEVRERDDGDHTCEEVQNKGTEFSKAFKRLICTQLGCSQEDDLEMTNSVINCGRPNSKEGIFTTTLRGNGAEQLVSMALQQREFKLRLEGGPSLTLNVVCEQGCSTAKPQVQSTDTPKIVGGVIAAFLVIVAVVIGAIVLTVLIIKSRKNWSCKKRSTQVTDSTTDPERGIAEPSSSSSPSPSPSSLVTDNLTTNSILANTALQMNMLENGRQIHVQPPTPSNTTIVNRPIRPNDLFLRLGDSQAIKKPNFGRSLSLDVPSRKHKE